MRSALLRVGVYGKVVGPTVSSSSSKLKISTCDSFSGLLSLRSKLFPTTSPSARRLLTSRISPGLVNDAGSERQFICRPGACTQRTLEKNFRKPFSNASVRGHDCRDWPLHQTADVVSLPGQRGQLSVLKATASRINHESRGPLMQDSPNNILL